MKFDAEFTDSTFKCITAASISEAAYIAQAEAIKRGIAVIRIHLGGVTL